MPAARERVSPVVFDLPGHAFEAEEQPGVIKGSPVQSPMGQDQMCVAVATTGRGLQMVGDESVRVCLGLRSHLPQDTVSVCPQLLGRAWVARGQRDVVERGGSLARGKAPHAGQGTLQGRCGKADDRHDLDRRVLLAGQQVVGEVLGIPDGATMTDVGDDHDSTCASFASMLASLSRMAVSSPSSGNPPR